MFSPRSRARRSPRYDGLAHLATVSIALLLLSCNAPREAAAESAAEPADEAPTASEKASPTASTDGLATATFAGGCFWCMETPFDQIPGVVDVTSGYTGGNSSQATYKQVSTGETGHVEAVEIRFDPEVVTYETLVDIFWKQIDPTDDGGQFVDRGTQYRSAIFYHSPEQEAVARRTRDALAASGRFSGDVVTSIEEATPFYPAEGYHQDFCDTNPVRYQSYRKNSGRDAFLDKVWGDERTPAHGGDGAAGHAQ